MPIFHPAAVKKNLRSRSIQRPRRSTDLSDGARPPVDGEAKALPPPADGGFTADVDGRPRRSSAPTIIGACARRYPTSGALAACPSTAPKAGRDRRRGGGPVRWPGAPSSFPPSFVPLSSYVLKGREPRRPAAQDRPVPWSRTWLGVGAHGSTCGA